MSETDVLKMKVADLKRELKLRGLPSTGNKIELQERLQAALVEGEFSLEDVAISEDLLDDEVLSDEEGPSLDLAQEEEILKPSKTLENLNIITQPKKDQHKKVILKRKNSNIITPPIASENEKIAKIENLFADNLIQDTNSIEKESLESKKVVKLSELSPKERLEMRAKKFGVPITSDIAKQARSERFGETIKNTVLGKNNISTPIDILKKRAERFGCSVSTQMVDIETKEKLQKRQQRFGDSDKPTTNGVNLKQNYADRAKQRLERFKTSVN